jgi:NAD+ synthase
MLVYKEKIVKYIKTWLEGSIIENNKDAFIVAVSGGLDSCVTAACALNATNYKKTILIFMGFKPEEESVFEKWVINNFAEKAYEIVKPYKDGAINLNLPGLEHIDARSSLILTYLDLYSKNNNGLTVGAVTKSEYSLVKFFRNRIDTSYDCYPIIDLYKSEVKEIAKHLSLPERVINSESLTEQSFGFTFDELEWLDRENDNLNIISALKKPNTSKYWALYNERNKKLVMEVFKLNSQNKKLSIPENKKCKIRQSLPGFIS